MRTTEARPGGPVRRTTRASVVALALALVWPGAAMADPDDPGTPQAPTRGQVERAEQATESAADRVAAIQDDLAVANRRLHEAGVHAEQAAEAYNGARWELTEATAALHLARADARRAQRQVQGQRDQLAGLVAATYQGGGEVSAVNAVLVDEGPEAMMSRLLAFQGASSSMDAQVQQFEASATLAEVFTEQAEEARAERLRLLESAERAKEDALAAASDAQALASAMAARKTELVAELARLQGISVALAEQRQSALEEIERQKAAAAAQAAAEAAAQAAAAEAEQQPEPEQPTEPETEAPAPAPPAPPVTTTPPPAGGSASRAIAFAEAQLGEEYVWGAAGPDAWDCSGLTMGAWQAGGVSLPHYSVAQYDATTPISADQLRPGDLVFWGSTSSPGSIHHVALYVGDGMIVHAPRTGRPVTRESMYYWTPPNFFGRV